MATTAAPIARNIRSRLRLSAAELGGLRKRTPIEKVDILSVRYCTVVTVYSLGVPETKSRY